MISHWILMDLESPTLLFSMQQVGKYKQLSLLSLSLTHSLEDKLSYIMFLSILSLTIELNNLLIFLKHRCKSALLSLTIFLSGLALWCHEMYTNAQRTALAFTTIPFFFRILHFSGTNLKPLIYYSSMFISVQYYLFICYAEWILMGDIVKLSRLLTQTKSRLITPDSCHSVCMMCIDGKLSWSMQSVLWQMRSTH